MVDAKKQLWNCLGACYEGGDVYRFVMKADGVDFRKAHRRLGGQEGEAKCVMVEDQQWLERAVDHYHARLMETPAAQDYLRLGASRRWSLRRAFAWVMRRDLSAEAAGRRPPQRCDGLGVDRLGA